MIREKVSTDFTAQVHVRMTQAQLSQLQRVSAEVAMSTSQYLRHLFVQAHGAPWQIDKTAADERQGLSVEREGGANGLS